MKKRMHSVLSVLLCCCLFVSVLSLNVSAAEINGFYSKDMTVKVTDPNDNDITSSVSVSSGTYLNKACTVFTLPTSDFAIRSVLAYHIENLNSSHEYNIKFSASSSLTNNAFQLALVFYDNDNNILKEQTLYNSSIGSSWTDVDIDFKPDATGLGGYKTRLEFRFVTSNKLLQYYRLSEIIEFTDKDDNSNWFQKIINAIKEIPEKIGDLRDNISNYFSSLGDRITAKFESVGTSITSKFEEVKNNIGNWFTEIGEKLSNKFAEVGNAITSKFQEIGAEFSATFDKFKPRVYEVFNWRYGWVSSDSIDYYDEDIGAAVISEGFYVPSGTSYIFNIEPSDFLSQEYFEMFQIDIFYFEDGAFQYIESTSLDLFFNSFNDGYVLPSGFTYYFSLMSYDGTIDSYLKGVSLSDFCNSVVRVYADEGWLTAFGQMILNGLKNFFIPSDDYFDTYSETTKTWAAEHFGFLYTAADLFSSVVEDLKGLLRDDYSFKIPPAKFTLMGTEYTLWEEYEVPMKEYLKNPALNFAYNTYLVMLSGALSFALLEYARKTYDKVMAN